MDNIFIGVDGGASKTFLIIEDNTGNILSAGISGPANISISTEKAWTSINNALNIALNKAGLNISDTNYNFYAGFGLAGLEVEKACQIFSNYQHPFKKLLLKSDAFTACYGAHGGNDGSIVIIGTGSIAYQMIGERSVRIGGWGFPHGDEGSGAWLGLELAKLTFYYIDGRVNSCKLFDNVIKKFNGNVQDFVTWANRANSTDFATLAPLLIAALKYQDSIAVNLVTKAADFINHLIYDLDKKAGTEERNLPLCMIGGIAPYIVPYMDACLKSRIVKPKYGPAKGAILFLKNFLNLNDII